ncbi:MAG: ABC transporter substrate-binding protein [Rhizonema sp. PD38]|nr:ABC transporter substrate-binding protein [Rhizonema sp. PD38]
MTQKKEYTRLLASLVFAGAFIVIILLWIVKQIGVIPPANTPNISTESLSQSATKEQQKVTTDSIIPVQARMSLGDKILVTADTNPNKQDGVQAFAKGDFATAISKFQASLEKNRNDPETLIYLNNAKIGQSPALKVVVSVPISGILNVSREILRGVAQAQDEVNRSGGINGVPLQLEIANDEGDLAIAEQLAHEFVKDKSVLAVVGHNRPDISIAAGRIYNQGDLVMVSPTSNASQLSESGKYIFSISPNTNVFADILAKYITQTARLKSIAICSDSNNPIIQGVIKEYAQSLRQSGGNITSTVCDFSALDFNPNAVIGRAISDGAEGLLLLPKLDKLTPAIDMARANNGRLALFTYGGMYTYETLNKGRENFKGMVLPVLWHPDAVSSNSFSDHASQLWGGRVNPRTATSYDALEVIIAGLKSGKTRAELQKALSDRNFSASGATGTIQFLPSGDRQGTPLLVRIDPSSTSGTGYDFTLVQ